MRESIETEIKLAMPEGATEAFQRVERHGFKIRIPRTLQIDQVFDQPGGELRRGRRLLRVRSENGRAILTYKGPPLPGRHKKREELEASTNDFAELLTILERLGYARTFRYEKYRTTLVESPGLPESLGLAESEAGIIALDETPIGVFLELEGPEDWIDHTALRLGFVAQDYITASYAKLYQTYLQTNQGPPDMIFSKGQ